MMQGTIYVTTDQQIVLQNSANARIVCIGEPDPNFVRVANAVPGSILMPPYQALMARLDGDDQTFLYQYNAFLQKKEPTMFMLTLFKAVMLGKNIILYLNQDEYGMYFGSLMRYMATTFGVIIGTPENEFCITSAFDIVTSYMYLYEIIDANEYIDTYPMNMQFPDFVIAKLSQETRIKPANGDTSINGYKVALYNYKQSKMIQPTNVINVMKRAE